MSSAFLAQHLPVARRIEAVSGIRPVTLLIASAIVLIIAILVATGIAANDLRQTTLRRTEAELARLDSVLAGAGDRVLQAAAVPLAEIAGELSAAGGDPRAAVASPQVAALLRNTIGHVPGLAAVAVLDRDGAVLAQAGAWPAAAVVPLPAAAGSPGTGIVLGEPLRDPQSGALGIPLVHGIAGPNDALAGTVVGIVPAAELSDLFAAAALPADARIVLLRGDGTVLARYPERADIVGRRFDRGDLGALFADRTAPMIRQAAQRDGAWRIEALRALVGFPAVVAVSRGADEALGGWARQGGWFAGFALTIAAAIGIMVYLIARQFETHAALAAIRSDTALAALHAEKLEVERARLAAEAELLKSERLSVLGQLTATVAHELRNPLSAIRNTLFTVKELAIAGGLKLDRPVARMERSIERCDRIISDLLEYTRTRDLNRSAIVFDAWLAEVAAEQTIAPPVVLQTELTAGEVRVALDPDRMRRVVINLVENAVHALNELPPDRDKRLVLRTAAADRELVLTIADSGPGIAPETLGRIFEPLFSTKSFGTGLGLPTVKQIVNQHGGTIAVESTPGGGTTVRVHLPLADTQAAHMQAAA